MIVLYKSRILILNIAASLEFFNNEKFELILLSKYSSNKSPIFSNIVKFVLITLKFNINGSFAQVVFTPSKAHWVIVVNTSFNNRALYVSLM